MKHLLAFVASPALQALLQMVADLRLPPLGHWPWQEDVYVTITYIVGALSAVGAYAISSNTTRKRALVVAGGVLVLLLLIGAYAWAYTTPPQAGRLWLHGAVAHVSFYLTYAAYGFCVGRLVKAVA